MSKKSRNIIDAYHRSLLSYVESKVGVIHALLEHQAEKGFANEEVLREILRNFLPSKYGIHGGFLVDSKGHLSPQIDIIITDELNHPRIFSKLAPMLHPIDSTVATIEVKTTLNLKELRKSRDVIRKTRASLSRIDKRYGRLPPFDNLETPTVMGPPLSIVFAYTQNKWKTVDGLLKAFRREMANVPNTERIDLVYVLNHALVIGWTPAPPKPHPGLYRPCCSAESNLTSTQISEILYDVCCMRPEPLTQDLRRLGVDESGEGVIMYLQLLLKFLTQIGLPQPEDIAGKYSPDNPLWIHTLVPDAEE